MNDWYLRAARDLPWRIGPQARAAGRQPDPYRVWLSEVMLQQTTAPHVAPYFLKFVERWPRVADLAAASWEEVSAAWAGLGYYSRARNLHACAKQLAEAGSFPRAREGLLALPGVGPYSAAAIASIAFDLPVAPVDGNIERVLSRVFAIGSDGAQAGWRAAKREIAARAQALFDAMPVDIRPGDIAQGMMDLGAMACTPRRPNCDVCPLARMCRARQAGEAERYPVKPEKTERPTRFGVAYVLVRGGDVLLVRRPPEGLLGGMMMPPTSAWEAAPPQDALADAPARADWEQAGEVRHVFTHFALRLDVWRAEAHTAAKVAGQWVGLDEALASLPTVGRKAVALAAARSGEGAATRRRRE